MNSIISQSNKINGHVSGRINMSGSLGKSEPTMSPGLNNPMPLPNYNGPYNVIPRTEDQSLQTTNKALRQDVLIESIPYYQTSNEYGDTVYIG